ncbi:hypothetical protein [Cellulosimicrobium funkei]
MSEAATPGAALLYEDEVVRATMRYLEMNGWTIESHALAHQHGDDIVATRGDERLIVEAKGAGSSKEGTRRFGQAFTRNQVGSHVSVAVCRALRVWSIHEAAAGLAFPDNAHHRSMVAPIQPALTELGITVFWVNIDGQVSTDPALA